MATIMLALHPEYIERIFSGQKQYEFRRRIPQNPVDTIIFYATAPISAVVGEAKVTETLEGSPESLWLHTIPYTGIEKHAYMEYFAGSPVAHAFRLGALTQHEKPKSLSEYGLTAAPQNFFYIYP